MKQHGYTLGGVYGGGAGFYGGGGGINGGGGGAGGALIVPGVTGSVQSGSGTTPFINYYNYSGIYGAGGSGTTGGTPYYAIEKVTAGTQLNVLQVNGNETISGGLRIQGYLPNSGNNSIFTSNDITASGAVQGNSIVSVGATINGGAGFYGYNTAIQSVAPAFCPYSLNVTGIITSSGNITSTGGNVQGVNVIATSDMRTKENIVNVDSALEKVLKLRGVYFNRKDTGKRSIGVIAQEIEEIIPEVVFTDDSPEQMKSVAYGNIIGLLIEALKQQQEQIELLKQNTK